MEVKRVIDFLKNRKGQISIFVIIALVIVAGIVIFFIVRGNLQTFGEDPEFAPVFNFYEECIRQESENALDLLGSQGGKIDTGEFVPGSEYAPFSSHLNFLGFPIPYWYYVSANGVITEQVPTRSDMEREAAEFISERLNSCDFSRYYEQGYYVELDDPRVNVEILEEEVDVSVVATTVVSREGRNARKEAYEVNIGSKLGKFHDIAGRIYEREKNDVFLEKYAIDVLRLNAPVDGVEVQCSPEIWQTNEVIDSIEEGLEANIPALKLRGDYYELSQEENEYFIIDEETDEAVNFLYSRQWPSKIEITPAEDELMIAEPIGNEAGLGVLGFCYVPYHFVYDVSFPVLIQIHDGLEIFQFPISVIIDNNVPRDANLASFNNERQDLDVCQFQDGFAEIHSFDTNLNPIEADISYKCFDSSCNLGSTSLSGNDAVLQTEIPLCVNGFLIAEAEGYETKQQVFSSNSEEFADIFLQREYEVEVEPGGNLEGTAVVHFVSEDYSRSAVLPENNKVKLKEGNYEISVFVYGDSNVVIPASTRQQCQEVPSRGLFGLFGSREEKCFDITIPETTIDFALTGGGKANTFIFENDLMNGRIILDVPLLPEANSIEQMQYNFEAFETLDVEVRYS